MIFLSIHIRQLNSVYEEMMKLPCQVVRQNRVCTNALIKNFQRKSSTTKKSRIYFFKILKNVIILS